MAINMMHDRMGRVEDDVALEAIGEEGPTTEAAGRLQTPRSQKRMRMTYDCDICGTSYTEKRTLVRHNRTPAHCARVGKSLPRYSCTICQKPFSRDDIRQRHEREKHYHIKRPVPSSASHKYRLSQSPEDCYAPDVADIKPINLERDHSRTSDYSDSIDGAPYYPRNTLEPSPQSVINVAMGGAYGGDSKLIEVPEEEPDYDTVSSATSQLARSNSSRSGDTDSPGRCTSVTTLDSDECAQDAVQKPAITAEDDVADDAMSITSTSTTKTIGRSWTLPLRFSRSRENLMKSGATPKVRGTKGCRPCTLCNKPFGDTEAEIKNHLERHFNELHAEHACEICQIGFVHAADLERHQQCARDGHCGFDFEHTEPCTGHHPARDTGVLNDSDQARLCNRLRHWEQSQLQAYTNLVTDVINASAPNADSDRWSIGAFRRWSTASSVSLVSRLDTSSAPDAAEYQARLDSHRGRRSGRGRAHAAALSRAKHAVKSIVKSTNPNEDDEGALIQAAFSADIEQVRTLLSRGANVNAVRSRLTSPEEKSSVFDTALAAAAYSGSKEVVDLLINSGADANRNVRKTEFGTVLCAAAANGNTAALECLLRHRADPNALGTGCKVFQMSPLCCAARYGQTEAVYLLLNANADVSVECELEKTSGGELLTNMGLHKGNALLLAAYNGHDDTVELLLRFGMNFKEPEQAFEQALVLAAERNHWEGAKSLIKYGPGSSVRRIFCDAISKDEQQLFRILLRCGVDANTNFETESSSQSEHGCSGSYLAWAVSHRNTSMVLELIESGAEVNAEVGWYGSALGVAVWQEDVSMVRLLLDHGASPDIRFRKVFSRGGVRMRPTPLTVASERDLKEILELLRKYNANQAEKRV